MRLTEQYDHVFVRLKRAVFQQPGKYQHSFRLSISIFPCFFDKVHNVFFGFNTLFLCFFFHASVDHLDRTGGFYPQNKKAALSDRSKYHQF